MGRLKELRKYVNNELNQLEDEDKRNYAWNYYEVIWTNITKI